MLRSFLLLTFVIALVVSADQGFQLKTESAIDQNTLCLDQGDTDQEHDSDSPDECCSSKPELVILGSERFDLPVSLLTPFHPPYQSYFARAPPVRLI